MHIEIKSNISIFPNNPAKNKDLYAETNYLSITNFIIKILSELRQ